MQHPLLPPQHCKIGASQLAAPWLGGSFIVQRVPLLRAVDTHAALILPAPRTLRECTSCSLLCLPPPLPSPADRCQVVVDPVRTMASGKVEIGAFRWARWKAIYARAPKGNRGGAAESKGEDLLRFISGVQCTAIQGCNEILSPAPALPRSPRERPLQLTSSSPPPPLAQSGPTPRATSPLTRGPASTRPSPFQRLRTSVCTQSRWGRCGEIGGAKREGKGRSWN
jgi:hypothetical protein